MAVPGVRTTLNDRFYTLSRTDIPSGPVVVAIGTRNTADGTNDVPDYDPYRPHNERDVINSFGLGSQLHRAYLELVSGGATRVALVALPQGTVDDDLLDTGNESPFELAFNAAEVAIPDIIVPWGRGAHPDDWQSPATPNDAHPFGFYADNSASAGDSLAKRVAEKCAEISNRSNPVFAVMGVKPYAPDASSVTTDNMTVSMVNTHLQLPNLIDKESDMGDNGQYLTVIATEIRPVGNNYSTFGYANGACHFAGHISTLPPEIAMTGKPVFNINRCRYVPTRTQQEAMIDLGVVPIATDFQDRSYYVDAMTFSMATSDFTRLSTLRIVFAATQIVRQIAQQFVGQPSSLHHRNALETAITTGLRGMTQAGAITGSDFVITYVPRENKAVIDLVVVPVFEMREIEINISVQL